MTDDPHWLADSARIGRVEFRRSRRALTADKRRLVLGAIGGAFLLLTLLLSAYAVYFFALPLRDGSTVSMPPGVGGLFVTLWLVAVFMFTLRTVQGNGRIDGADFLLTTVSPREIVLGVLLAEYGRAWIVLALPLVLVAGAFVLGAQTPLSVMVIPVATATFVASALAVGYVLGLCGATLVARIPLVARHKTVFGLVAALAFVAPLYSDAFLSALTVTPLGWYADLLVVGTPIAFSPLRAGGALVGSVLLTGLLIPVSIRLATSLWYADPSTPREPKSSARTRTTGALTVRIGPVDPLSVVSNVATRGVAGKTLVRARRTPSRFLYLLFPAIVFLPSVTPAQGGGGGGLALLPAAIGLYGAWMTGSLFTLNPLGDEGPFLPAALTSTITGREFVRGVMIPGMLFVAPLVGLATLVVGLAIPAVSPPLSIGFSVFVLALAAASVLFGTGLGMAMPRFGTRRITRNKRVVTPSALALGVYSMAVGVLGASGTLTLLAPDVFGFLIAELSGVPVWWIRIGGTGLVIAIALLAGGLSYSYAVRRFERYTLD